MACFAEINSENIVTQVIAVNDEVVGNKAFPETDQIGIDFCRSLFGQQTNWKQTSPEGAFRKHYAGIGFAYNPALDAFIPPKPYNSWMLNPVECTWECPVEMPSDGKSYRWDEDSINWVATLSKP
jgi:hypothetical protein